MDQRQLAQLFLHSATSEFVAPVVFKGNWPNQKDELADLKGKVSQLRGSGAAAAVVIRVPMF